MGSFAMCFQVRSLLLALCIASLSLGRGGVAQDASAGKGALPANSITEIAFGKLKGLSGTWTGQVTTDPPNPEINGPIQVTMRVASAGNVVMHEIAPGGIPEPTMIYLEDGRLTLVHYCEAGNRPRLIAVRSTNPNAVEFRFVDISGSKSPVYLESFVFTIIDANHHAEDWTFKSPDNSMLHAHFDLKRANGVPVPTTQR
ncbi:MAG: hypothetical protein WA399_07760 [Acidobacteriaceae bacterium]